MKYGIIFPVLALALLLTFQCSRKDPVSPETVPAGSKKVSLSSAERFSGDLSRFPGFESFYSAIRKTPDSLRPPKAGKALADIPFHEARVIVVNMYDEEKYFHTVSSQAFYCSMAQANHKAFSGRKPDRFDDLVAGLREYGFLDVVYTGTLSRSGSYVEGDILVKPGMNSVITCFVNDSGKIFYTSYADYLYLSEVWNSLYPGDTSTIEDGWQMSWEYAYNHLGDSIWSDQSYYGYPMYSYDSCYYPAFTYYYLPALGMAGELGLSQEYADHECGACVDTSSHVVTSSWKTAGPAGFSMGFASLVTLRFPSSGGNPYVAYRDGGYFNRAVVQQFNDTTWLMTGGTSVSSGGVGSLAMAMNRDTPYVAYADTLDNLRVTVKRWAGTSWQTIGTGPMTDTAANDLALAVDVSSNQVYVAYSNTRFGGFLTVLRYNGSSWDTVGTPQVTASSVSRISLAYDSYNGALYAAFTPLNSGNRATVMKYFGNWLPVGNPAFSTNAATSLSLALGGALSDTPYVAYDDGTVQAMRFNGSAWAAVGAPLAYGGSSGVSLSIFNGQKRVGFGDGAMGFDATVYEYTGTVWTSTGLANFSTSSIGSPSLAHSATGVPHLAFEDGYNGNRLTVMYYGP